MQAKGFSPVWVRMCLVWELVSLGIQRWAGQQRHT